MECKCVKNHSPKALAFQVHHVWPTSWGGPNTKENKVVICGTCHDNTHTLLNLYVRYAKGGKRPPASEIRKFPKYSQELARRAMEAVNWNPPMIFTMGSPLEEFEADERDMDMLQSPTEGRQLE